MSEYSIILDDDHFDDDIGESVGDRDHETLFYHEGHIIGICHSFCFIDEP